MDDVTVTTPPHDEKRLQRLRAKASRLDEAIRQLEDDEGDRLIEALDDLDKSPPSDSFPAKEPIRKKLDQ